MPHIVVEYSTNLAPRIDVAALLRALHRAALDTGVFPIGGLRTRAAPRQDYVIADGHPDNAFVHVTLRIGHGRDLATKQRAGDRVFGALCAFLDPVFRTTPLGISLEIQEIDPDLSFKHNNLHDIVKRRQGDTGVRP
ncbi:MAG: 5-carboxymethyl-2-hydroxymuconate Delta-isomerase [Gammaproteobacteria bacterium]